MFSALQYKLFGLSFVLLVLGYICLGQGPVNNHLSWSVAPAVLVGVYCILLPVAIVFRGREKDEKKR
jgi:hypothetical protein